VTEYSIYILIDVWTLNSRIPEPMQSVTTNSVLLQATHSWHWGIGINKRQADN